VHRGNYWFIAVIIIDYLCAGVMDLLAIRTRSIKFKEDNAELQRRASIDAIKL